ncbi:MAG: lysoplasmalogenase [Acetivibrionales bacterium]|jgi:uncharacterized membrane protein YhhN
MAGYWYLLVFCGCVIQAAFIRYEYAEKPGAALVLKGLASAVFVLLGFSLLPVCTDPYFGRLVTTGLIFGAIGDVLLALKLLLDGKTAQNVFMAGIAAFLAGHVLYIAALITRDIGALWVGVPVCAVLSVALLPFFILRRIEVEKNIKNFGIVYVVMILLMTGAAAGLLAIQPFNPGYLLFAVGAVFFTLSDIVLIFALFGKKKHQSFRAINLSAYYAGQVLIALSLMLV